MCKKSEKLSIHILTRVMVTISVIASVLSLRKLWDVSAYIKSITFMDFLFFFFNLNYQTWNFQSFSGLAYLLPLLDLMFAKETQKFTSMKSDKQNLIIVVDSYFSCWFSETHKAL